MPTISIAEVEARSGIEKQPGETLSEYLRRVGARTELSDDDVEAVVTELQRQQFAGETVTAEDADAPIEAFLAAVDAIGADGTDDDHVDAPESDGEPDDDSEPGDAEHAGNEEREGAVAGTASSPSPSATGDEPGEGDAFAFYRSVAVLGVIILLGAGVLGSALLLGTDLGPDDDNPETAGDTDALEGAPNGTDDGSGGSDDAENATDEDVANGSGTNDATANATEADEDTASDGAADDADQEGTSDDVEENDTAGSDEDGENDSEPIGFDGNVTDTDTNDTDGVGDDTDEEDVTNEENDSNSSNVGEDGDEDGPDDADPDVVDSAPEATGMLAVTDRAAPGDHPADEYVELTNIGDEPLDMSGWTVRDREGGAVDTHGLEPLEFPEGIVLEPGASVRLVTGDGEDTADTIYWGHERQYWRGAGDVVIVRDEDGEEVLRHPYGDQA